MRIAVIGTNDPRNVSGGRYHALMLACAAASLGWEAHVVTDHKPSFFDDLAALGEGGLRLCVTPDFVASLPAGGFDWVLIVPTGVFLPEFYEACLDFARGAGARVGLVNFESANWFNALAPTPRDPRIWDAWRRICLEGALVLSSARESDAWARRFYRAPEAALRFEVWQPPVNSLAARRSDGLEKDGSLVAFIRPQDGHKGADLLTGLDPGLLRGRTLHLVSGREPPGEYKAAIATHLADVSFHLRIDDVAKFRLLTKARAVLFPSRFEGYGYPPVEAAFAGTESVVFDLPVLRETVGRIAHFAPTPDLEGFQRALECALAAPERRAALHQAVFPIADFSRCAERLGEILLRSADVVAPLRPRGFRVLVGPFRDTPPQAPESRGAPSAPFPAHVIAAVETSGGDLLATVRIYAPARSTDFAATAAGCDIPLVVAATRDTAPTDGFEATRLYFLAPQAAQGRRIVVTAREPDAAAAHPILELRIDRATDADLARPALAGLSEYKTGPDGLRLRGWALAREPLTEVLLSPDGASWRSLAIVRDRRDIAVKFPAYATARCEFQAQFPDPLKIDRNRATLLYLAGDGRAVDATVGWPPRAAGHFRDAPAERGTGRPLLGEIALAPLRDAHWRNGVALVGGPGRLGAVAVSKETPAAWIKPGVVLRFASGAARRIVATSPQDGFLLVTLDGPLEAEAVGDPPRATAYDGDWTADAERVFTLPPRTDARWRRGVWNGAGDRFRRGFTIPGREARALGLKAGTALRFAASGVRRIQSVEEQGEECSVWLDGPIRPLGDMEPKTVAIVGRPAPDGLAYTASNGGGAVTLEDPSARRIRPGDLVRLDSHRLARVLAVNPGAETTQLILDRSRQDAPATGTLKLVDETEAPDGYLTPYLRPGFGLTARDPLYRTLARDALRRGSALPPVVPARESRPRALVVSLVSPCPANQGNRVVTRNLIRHLIDLGLDCDVVVQNDVDSAAAADAFGDHARFFPVAYPNWQAAPAHTRRKAIAEAAEQLRDHALDLSLADAIDLAASRHHPYCIVRDETVDLARALYAQRRYDALILNYTHMARVAEELRALRPLPPTAIFTHDALSRLPGAFAGRKLDHGHRACSAEMEREALDAAPGACVVAISRYEADYFRAIGVTNRIVTAEYDAAGEMTPHAASSDAFARRTMIFHASANAMNVAGLDWFVDECLSQIQAAEPRARLVVCGLIGAAWDPKLPGVEVFGDLPRDRMLSLCADGSVAINPCVAGTGLKIKTVETAALGVPAVCLPGAVEGLEDIAEQFAIVAADAEAFIAGCVALLTDRARWSALHASALAIARRRFSASTVYRDLDAAMGWGGLAAPNAEPDEAASRPDGERDEETAAFARAKVLALGGQTAAGWPQVDRIATARRGDAEIAAEAAEIGLAVGTPWRAAVHAARIVAQEPTSPRGYRLMGRALLACGQAREAAAAFEQALMTAPFDAAARAELVEALVRAGQPERAEFWRARVAQGGASAPDSIHQRSENELEHLA